MIGLVPYICPTRNKGRQEGKSAEKPASGAGGNKGVSQHAGFGMSIQTTACISRVEKV